MLITVRARMVKPYGHDEVPLPDRGRVEFKPAAHGTYGRALRTRETVFTRITDGVMKEVELAPGPWRVRIWPEKDIISPSWESWLIELTEGMVEPVDLVDLAPVLVVDGEKWARGADGLSAYEVAVADGFEGTEQEWLDSLKGDGADLTGYATEEWVSETAAPAEHRHPGDQIDIVYNVGGNPVPIDAQFGISRALDLAFEATQEIPVAEQRARDYTDQQIAELPGTAPQTLALTGRDLSISGGNTVTLPASAATVPSTGWRNITGLVAAGSLTSGNVYLIRIGSVVTLHVKTAVLAQGTYFSWWVAPTGFAWPSWRRDKAILRREGGSFDTTVVILDQPAAGQISAVSTNGALTCTGSFSWITDDPWPAGDLPGIPV